ncbi:unnamed protein product, partial [Mesorhabditis belari]|uniref:Anaphase-promoting complex subunit 4-like WD40 domain-containing protein n=1 Tax=Mesorhabditis belari TaxID=2138241 RepID=A0AAF3EE24_9BILA
MFIYLSKKIGIPSETELHCVEWNHNTNFIAAGGTNGILKIVKLAPIETPGQGKATTTAKGRGDPKGLATPTNLSVNQNLEGHTGTVICASWNEMYQKLTTSDSNGLIIVWSLHNESWYEEMINNRNKSMVVGMAWSIDGSRIAIAYQDGQVIVGTMDGNRVWNKELPSQLAACCWTHDGSSLLFGLVDGEVHAYDSQGNFLQKLHMVALENVELETALAKDLRRDKIVSLRWWAPVPKTKYIESGSIQHRQTQMFNRPQGEGAAPRLPRQQTFDGVAEVRGDARPRLLIAYEHGVIQLMRNESDTNSILVRLPQMSISCAAWAPNGGFLSVTGQQMDLPQNDRNVVIFLTAYGQKLRLLKVQGISLTSCAWDPTGLRVALSVDSNIYFANIRPDYIWGYCSQTVVYAHETDRGEFRVVFFDTQQEEFYSKPVRFLEAITCFDEYCVIGSRAEDGHGSFLCQLCNGMGTPLDFKYTEVRPLNIAMNGVACVIASEDSFYIWHFNLPKKSSLNYISLQKPSTEQDIVHFLDGGPQNSFNPQRKKKANDGICSIAIADTYFIMATESGSLYKFALSDGTRLGKFPILANIEKMYFNCNYTKLAIVNHHANMRLFEVNDDAFSSIPGIERRDVWNLKWDHEKDDTMAVMEKTRLIVIRGKDTEEPVVSSGYIASFKGLTVRTVLVDQFLQHPDNPEKKFVIDIEVKALRDAKYLLDKMKVSEATAYIERNPHPRLWSLLAEVALNKSDLTTAEHAYVMLKDYHGLQFCKRAAKIDNPQIRQAEIYAHLGRLDEAEQLFMQADRRDLAIDMYKTYQDWFRILKILQTSSGPGDDALLRQIYDKLGDYFFERQKWQNAIPHYEQSKNMEQLFKCYLMLDDYNSLRHLATQLPDAHPLLIELAELFGNAGLCELSVENYLRCDRLNDALDICIQLNQWEKAVTLSRTHNLRDVDSLLGKYAEDLTGSNERTLAAVQLYRRAGRYLQAAKIVFEIADDERRRTASLLRLKKLYVLGALMIEEYHQQQRAKLAEAERKKDKNADEAKIALSGLLAEDISVNLEESRMIDNAWRGAEAYHFFMLAQRQLYRGNADAAMKTAYYLIDFDDILDSIEVYTLLALTSCVTKQFSVASRAFMKLDSLNELTEEEKDSYRKLAIKIFSKYPPTDTVPNMIGCINCDQSIPDYSNICPQCDIRIPMCVVTGKPLFDYQFWLCPNCKHRAYEQHIGNIKFCPLCHHEIA